MKIRRIQQNPIYDAISNIFIALNISLIAIKDFIELFSASKHIAYSWVYFQMCINLVFFSEMVLILVGFGIIKSLTTIFHLKFELASQVFIMIAFIHFVTTQKLEFVCRTFEIIIIIRTFRIFGLFNEISHWKVINKTILSLIKPFKSFLLVMFIVFLLFSIIGDRLFGGLTYLEPVVVRNQNIPNLYLEMNFNDNVNSFITLFALIANNNWLTIEEVFIK